MSAYRNEAIEDKVARLDGEVSSLEEKVEKLSNKSEIPRIDMSEYVGVVKGTLAMVAMLSVLGVLVWYLVTTHQTDAVTRRLHSAELHEQSLVNAENAEARHLRQEAEALQLRAESATESTRECTVACDTFSFSVIRSSPCLCGANGSLIVFSEDYTSMTRVQEVESLVTESAD